MADFNLAITEIQASIASFGAGPEARTAFAAFAAQCRDDVIASDHPDTVTQFVDGRQDAPLDSAEVPGTIRFEFGYLAEIVQGILDMLVAKSPYREKAPDANVPTHYRDEHAIFVDGIEVTDAPNTLKSGQIVTLVNLQPYSRKIEKGFSLQAPSGVYEVVASEARRRWGNIADISFGYDVFPGAGPNQTDAVRKNKKRSHADDRFPTITIKAIA